MHLCCRHCLCLLLLGEHRLLLLLLLGPRLLEELELLLHLSGGLEQRHGLLLLLRLLLGLLLRLLHGLLLRLLQRLLLLLVQLVGLLAGLVRWRLAHGCRHRLLKLAVPSALFVDVDPLLHLLRPRALALGLRCCPCHADVGASYASGPTH